MDSIWDHIKWLDWYLAACAFEIEGNLMINCLAHLTIHVSSILLSVKATWKDSFSSKRWIIYYPLTSQMRSILVKLFQYCLSNFLSQTNWEEGKLIDTQCFWIIVLYFIKFDELCLKSDTQVKLLYNSNTS